jgi:PAS domain S-box-containing protein
VIATGVDREIPYKNQLGVRLLVLISIPVVVQLMLIAGIFYLRNAAEDQAIHCGIAREASEAVCLVTGKALTILKMARSSMKQGLIIDYQAQTELSKINVWTEWMKSLPNAGKMGTSAIQVRDISNHLVAIVKSACVANREALAQKRDLKYTPLSIEPKVTKLEDDLVQNLEDLKNEQMAFSNSTFESGSMAQYWLFMGAAAGIVINLGTLSALGLYFSKDIVARLAQVQQNVKKIQLGSELLNRVKGKDEIALLDNSFHEMAGVLTQVEEKEKTLFEHAYNVLCSVDSNRRFVEINQASLKVIGYRPEELIGRAVEMIVTQDEQLSFVKNFEKLMDSNSQASIESTIKRKDGTLVDTLWTTSSSPDTDKIFCVVHDISERKSAQRLRKEMVKMVTNDLRSPLTSLGSVYTMLQENRLGSLNAQGIKLLTAAQANSGRMLRLINDLLDIEKLEAGMLQLEKSPTVISAIFDQSLDSVLPLANKKQIRLFNNASGSPVTANIDAHRIVQVLVNLLSNAIKFSPQGGNISVNLRTAEDRIEIQVADQGRGIPQDMLNEVFNRFQQVQKGDATEKGGSGLGLAICKSLIELHNGTISVNSVVGKGSVFVIVLPR